MSAAAAVIVVTPSPVRAALSALGHALWVRFASVLLLSLIHI